MKKVFRKKNLRICRDEMVIGRIKWQKGILFLTISLYLFLMYLLGFRWHVDENLE